MHIFLDYFHQVGKYTAQIESHQAELRREENFTDQKYFIISSLHTDYLNLDRSSGSGRNNEREILFIQNALSVELLTILQRKCFKRIR